ncbi:ammonium transporter [SAR86 cluster bacterium]|jgi:Amt family ammonium transporter|nr:ammonium transporter [SAR86 cluster bacterium]MDC3151009.1 ammonium transporter [SAR86 cluster bacterium]|tara:strand:- start:207 stop:1412 length:1206 start_codon:yes stop_codon:yes gene_type:complete
MDTGSTAWILTSTALVLFMTMPGLALFYGGLVKSENVLSVLMHCFGIACVASVTWLGIGYSIAFSSGNPFFGDLSQIFLLNMARDSMAGEIPESVFFMFQMTFCIITPALIVGAYPERMKFGFILLFSFLWIIFVYAPVTHWIWGGGWLAELGVLDFAGGLVVHLTAGTTAIVLAIMSGTREGFPDQVKPPHNPGLTMMGACMLWVGWFGFNGGSALAANSDAGMAILVTHISASVASLVWIAIEWMRFGKPSLVGVVTGAIAGLASITPASGFVGPLGAVLIGLISGYLCYEAVGLIKNRFKVDDSLDVFAVHGLGGTIGILLLPLLISERFGGIGYGETNFSSFMMAQFIGVIAVLIFTLLLSFLIAVFVKRLIGIRVSDDDIEAGLDISSHGQSGYKL